MTTPQVFARPLLLIGLALPLLAACTPEKGYHPGVQAPENHADIHKPRYIIKATLADGEMEAKTLRQEIYHGDPPAEPPYQPWSETTAIEDTTPTSIEIEAGLAEACKIPHAKAFFDTDSSSLEPAAQAALDALAQCFIDGPLAGHKLSITGHADPRGTEKYNKELGWERAAAVADRLAEAGLQSNEMEQESAGEEQASEDPERWPYDRKVVLDIAVDTGEGEAAPEGEGDTPEGDAAPE